MSSPYHDHLRRSLRYIEDHLTEDISLDGCAAAAGYSLYHFHRVFHMVFGLPPGEYIRRRRLAVAAELMVRTSMSLDGIAEACGYSCKEVLIRAFQREHGISPSSYRRARNCLKLMPDIGDWSPDHASDDTPLVPRIAALPAMTIVGYAVTVPWNRSRDEIPKLWNRYNAQLLRHSILNPLPDMHPFDIGLSIDRNHYGQTYIAGRPVVQVQDDLGERVVHSIPSREYAVFTTPRASPSTFVATVHRTWDRIVREWIPSSPWPADQSYDFELYCEASRTYSEEIWVPILRNEKGGTER